MFTTNLVNLYNRNIFKTSLYIYIFQDEKCRLMRNLSLSIIVSDLIHTKEYNSILSGLIEIEYYRELVVFELCMLKNTTASYLV